MLAIKARHAFDGERLIRGGATVMIDQGQIIGVQPAAAPLPQGCEVAGFPQATLLPGLIDTHVHLGGDGRDGALGRLADYPDENLAEVIEAALRRHLAAGVTTVRDLGDRRWSVVARRDRAATPEASGVSPTIVASGPPITSVGGHCWYLGGEIERGEAALRAAIRERIERRVNVIKIMVSGGVLTTGTDVMGCQFGDDDLRLVVDQAHAAGLPVTAHAHGLSAVEQAVAAGVDGIEHGNCVTPAGTHIPDSLLDRLAEQGTAVCPTILARIAGIRRSATESAFIQRFGLTSEAVQAQIARMHRAGTRIVAGTDGGIATAKPHGIVHAAISGLVASGLCPARALAAATSVAAQVCGLGSRKGRLHAGYDADLILVEGDPLSDVSALIRPTAVMVHGRWAARPSTAEWRALGQP